VQWYDTIFQLIDMRSFSNLWFWIALAVMWSSASHWVLGVPFDLVLRARRHAGQAEVDLRDMVRVNVNRLMHIARVSGLWLVGLVSCLLTMLASLGFYYGIEFAQAVFTLATPMTLVGVLSLNTARRIEAADPDSDTLYRMMSRHRMAVQGIGMVSIFVTALWGMYQNMAIGAL
jgi:hypothetical protein